MTIVAVKYGGSATASLTPEAERVVVTVEDEGPGVSRSEREKVFEPFYRIESSRNPDRGGVGLGLSVARSIIWEHGGDIGLATRKGGGLIVRLELPVGSGFRIRAQKEPSSDSETTKPRMRAVDDRGT